MKLSIRFKVIGTVVFIIGLMGAIATITIYLRVNQALQSQADNNLISLAETHSDTIASLFSHSSKVVSAVSRQPSLINYLRQAQPEFQSSNILNFLASYNFNNDYSAIYLLNQQGIAVVSTDSTFVGKDYSFRSYFSKSSSSEVFVDTFVGVTSNTLGYYFSSTVADPDTLSPLGVIVFKLKPEVVADNLHDHSAGSSINFKHHLIHRSGVVIFSPDEDKLYKSLGPLSPSVLQNLLDNQTFAGHDIGRLTYDSVQSDLTSLTTPRSYHLYDKFDQKSEIVTISPVGNYPFFMMIEADNNNITQATIYISATIAFLVATTAVIALLLITLIVNRIIRPLKAIELASSHILSGDLSRRVNIKTGDELEVLANNFNQVADKLTSINDQIKAEVDIKTADLQKINRFMVDRELKMIELKKKVRQLEDQRE